MLIKLGGHQGGKGGSVKHDKDRLFRLPQVSLFSICQEGANSDNFFNHVP
jgi:hypothetical protein